MAKLALDRGLALLDKRTKVVGYTIYVYLAASAAALAAQVAELAGFVDLENGYDEASAIATVAVLMFVVSLLASVVVIAMWIYRAHANLHASGAFELSFSPGWAVGWYFVPIANLFKPFQAMKELWNVSHLRADSYVSDNDPLLTVWWGLWVIGNVISNISFRLSAGGGEKAQLTSLFLDIASTLMLAVAAWFLLRIVQSINAAQQTTVGLDATFA